MHNFIGLNRKHDNFRKSTFIDPFDEPTYLTFALDFMFETVPSHSSIDEINLWNSPLFKEKGGTIDFLTSRSYNPQADEIKTFKEILRYLTFHAPWYFQKITGLQKLYAMATDQKLGARSLGADLTIDTLEAIDLRINELAGLYRNAIFDAKYRRERVPDNLRWFSMDIYLAEFRNLRYRLPGVAQNTANLFGVNTAAIGNIIGGGNIVSNVLKQYGFIKFKCRQCEFDFSDTLPVPIAVTVGTENRKLESNKFGIKIGWVEEEVKYADGSQIYDDNFKTSIKNPWGTRNIGTSVQNFGSFLSGLPVVGEPITEFGEKVGESLASIGGLINPALEAASNFFDPPVSDLGDFYDIGYTSNGDKKPKYPAEPTGNFYD